MSLVRIALLAVVALLTMSGPADAVPLSGMLRSQTRNLSGTLHHQAQQAVRPRLVIQSRYAAAMNGVAFSRDGRWLATAGAAGQVQLWDLHTGQQVEVFKGHGGALLALLMDDGRKRIISAGAQGVAAWDLLSGKPVYQLAGHTGAVTALAISPDGRILASAGADWSVRLWNAEDGRALAALDGHHGAVMTLAFAPDGRTLASAGKDGKVVTWTLPDGRERNRLDAGMGSVYALAFNADGSTLAVGGSNGQVRLMRPSGGESRSLNLHEGAVYALAFAADGRLASAGADGKLRLWSHGGDALTLDGHQGAVHGLAFSADGRYLASAAADRTVRLWEVADGTERIRLVSMLDGWASLTPEGYFDGTLDGHTEDRVGAIKWGVEDKLYSLEGFLERYYQPGLLGRLLSGVALAPTNDPTPDVSDGFLEPPQVDIEAPAKEALSAALVPVSVLAKDLGGGIDEIKLYHNGKALDASHAVEQTVGEKSRKKTYEVAVVGGENRFEAVALSRDRIEGVPAHLSVTVERQSRQSTLHLVVIGINAYRNPMLTLNFGVPDARGIADAVAVAAKPLFKAVQVHTLFDRDATRRNINAVLTDLRDSAPDDVVLVYLAGHGESLGDTWYFVPYELLDPENPASLRERGISSLDIRSQVARIGARRVLLLMDSCKSGAAQAAFSQFEDYRPVALLARAAGIHVGAASTKEQFAAEIASLGHGVFTYTLLGALHGAADTEPNDGLVTINEIRDYVRGRMPILILRYNLPTQDPVFNSRGQDFPLVGHEGQSPAHTP